MLEITLSIVRVPDPDDPLPFSIWCHLPEDIPDVTARSESFILGSFRTLQEAKMQVISGSVLIKEVREPE